MYRLLEIVLFILVVQVLGSGFFVYLLLREMGDAFRRYWKEGVISLGGLKYTRDKNPEIALADVNIIKGGYERSPVFSFTVFVDVNTVNGIRRICLDDEEIVKFTNTHLNQIRISTKWDIDKDLISIMPSTNGEMVRVLYDPVGKYALAPYLPNLLGFIVFAVAVGGLFFKLFHISVFYALFAIFAMICCIPPFYKQVSVMINSEGILIKDGNYERLISFKEVARVEKTIFRTKIITKTGDIVYFPKACYLLPEFIAEMTKFNSLD